MPRTYLGLGGNVGNVAATFSDALRALQRDRSLQVLRTSSLYRTAAIGDNAGDDFLNAVAEIDTNLPPLDLLKLTQSVETALGRTHTIHWGPRTLDIDILLYGDETVNEPDLTIPHPALWYRRFVLDPLAEIAPDVTYPNLGSSRFQSATIYQLRQRLLIRPFQVHLACSDFARRDSLITDLESRFPNIEFGPVNSEWLTIHSAEGSDLLAQFNPPERLSVVRDSAVVSKESCRYITVADTEDHGLPHLSTVIKAATDAPVVADGPIHL